MTELFFADDEVHKAFLRREDIRVLPPEEQERRWQDHLPRMHELQDWLASLPKENVFVVGRLPSEPVT